jgi:hypothetical protein
VRPVRLGLIVEPDNEEDVRRAVVLATRHWGGLVWPILPIDDPDRCCQWADALNLDASLP